MSRVDRILAHSAPELDREVLRQTVLRVIDRKEEFLAAAASHGSPLYLFDPASLRKRAREFRAAFQLCRRDAQLYYALKSNSYPGISHLLVDEGFGLDVSSGLELEFALTTNAERIIFSGPGKLTEELTLAVNHAARVTILADSPTELDRIEEIARQAGVVVRTGIRLTSDDHGIWRKFGVPLDTLADLFARAQSYNHVRLCGLQFHISWNRSPEKQLAFIRRLGNCLDGLPRDVRSTIEFVDVGGGFWPPAGDWMQLAATPQGMIKAAVDETAIAPLTHYAELSAPITEFARAITAALTEHFPGDMEFVMCAEPGRWLCHEAMHMLLTVVDRKADDVVITDGGTNAIGWDRFESDYFPVVNLTRPSLTERECLVAGSLCTPHDLWGYSYFGSDIQAGDILLIPNQGAYTWSLRQNFIKPLPEVARLEETSFGDSNGAGAPATATDATNR